VLLYVLGGNVYCVVFSVAMCVVRSFSGQSELLGPLGGKVSCWVF